MTDDKLLKKIWAESLYRQSISLNLFEGDGEFESELHDYSTKEVESDIVLKKTVCTDNKTGRVIWESYEDQHGNDWYEHTEECDGY